MITPLLLLLSMQVADQRDESLPVAQSTITAAVALPGWMAGCWIAEGARGMRTEECWTVPRGEMMLASSHSFVAGQSTWFEHMRIVADAQTLVFMAQPGGNAATRFPLADAGGANGSAYLVFENRAHDYPQRIRYEQVGDLMLATISLADGSRSSSWTFRRASGP